MERGEILKKWLELWEEESRVRETVLRPSAIQRKELEAQDAEFQKTADSPFYIRYDDWCSLQKRTETC